MKFKKFRPFGIASDHNMFLLQQLIKRDFSRKYKGTMLGFAWSILSPMFMLLVMNTLYAFFFARTVHYFTIYLFSGYILYTFFNTSTTGVMTAFETNAAIIKKVKVKLIYFVIASELSFILSFLCTLLIYFGFVAFSGLKFSPTMLLAIIPITYTCILSFAFGLMMAVLYTFIKDVKYIYQVIMRVLMYASAIFYSISTMSEKVQAFFFVNPLYVGIAYLRAVMIDGIVPNKTYHLYMGAILVIALAYAVTIYRKLEKRIYLYL